MNASCEHAVDCEYEEVFDYVGDIVVTHRPIEDTCSIRVTGEDKIRFLYVGGSQYMGTNVFFDEVFLLEDAEAIRDALTRCINKIKNKNTPKLNLLSNDIYETYFYGQRIKVWDRLCDKPQLPHKYLKSFYDKIPNLGNCVVTEIWYDSKNGNVGTIICNLYPDESLGIANKEIFKLMPDELELAGWFFHIEWKIIRNVK